MHKPANSPIKVIGGQHRFEAIRFALENSVDVLHGVKVYFALDMPQRLLVVNTSDGYGTWRPYGDDSDQFALTFKTSMFWRRHEKLNPALLFSYWC